MTDQPDFLTPPVVEVALDVQFHPIPGLRGLNLAALREAWREAYPNVEEHPPLPSAIEDGGVESQSFQVAMGPPPTRYWFLSADSSELVQVQHDRCSVNWRKIPDGDPYPRYEPMRALFERRAGELDAFVRSTGLGRLEITQSEISYVNSIDVPPEELGHLDHLLRAWQGLPDHHLGEPVRSQVALVFDVPGVGLAPVRMHVQLAPARSTVSTSAQFLSFTVRGNPGGGTLGDALTFLDSAHDHVVRSFAELTPESMHPTWGRRR